MQKNKEAVVRSFSFVQPPLVCAVPLRGCGFEMTVVTPIIKDKDGKFPSPCGDVVLKYVVFFAKGIRSSFPSPCGDVVLKSLRLRALCRVAQNGVLRRGSDEPPFLCVNMF